ncbi:MAG: hypothetical protein GVY16_12150 [Planctomycetes bacterium]|jgi:aminomethyltransferase|nr:hypothetical protein [Phycisphaerae bacterium]NBB96474.1 hypothetical protein [Planctomycetota bacterium]
MADEPLQMPLHETHLAAEATMGSAGGWSVPMHYGCLFAEAERANGAAGLFDLSHLGRLRIRGNGALDLLERVCTHDVAHQEDDTAELTCLCNERGGIINCGFLYRLPRFWVLTTNPDCREKVLAYLTEVATQFDGVRVDDQTRTVAQFGAVGPHAEALLGAVLPINIEGLPRGTAKMGSLMVANYIASRTGLTRQWSLEVMVPNAFASQAWTYVTKKAGDNAIRPCGHAARDILRMQAVLPRYGHEINETIDPVTASLERCVDFGHDFIGGDAVRKMAERGPQRRRVLLKLDSHDEDDLSIPRLGTPLYDDEGREIGTVTSGTLTPTGRAVMVQAYVVTDMAETQVHAVLDEPSSRTGLILHVCGDRERSS